MSHRPVTHRRASPRRRGAGSNPPRGRPSRQGAHHRGARARHRALSEWTRPWRGGEIFRPPTTRLPLRITKRAGKSDFYPNRRPRERAARPTTRERPTDRRQRIRVARTPPPPRAASGHEPSLSAASRHVGRRDDSSGRRRSCWHRVANFEDASRPVPRPERAPIAPVVLRRVPRDPGRGRSRRRHGPASQGGAQEGRRPHPVASLRQGRRRPLPSGQRRRGLGRGGALRPHRPVLVVHHAVVHRGPTDRQGGVRAEGHGAEGLQRLAEGGLGRDGCKGWRRPEGILRRRRGHARVPGVLGPARRRADVRPGRQEVLHRRRHRERRRGRQSRQTRRRSRQGFRSRRPREEGSRRSVRHRHRSRRRRVRRRGCQLGRRVTDR